MFGDDPPPVAPPWAEAMKKGANIVSLISIAVVIFPIATYLIFKRQKRTQLPFYMCIASLGLNLSSNMGTYTNDYMCLYEAVGIEFFSMATLLWWLCMSYNFYLVSVKEVTSMRVLRLESRYNIFVWIYSSLLTLIAIATDNLDTVRRANSYVCWIREDKMGNQWIFFYSHLLVVFVIGLFFWPRSLHRLYHVHVYQEPSDKQLMIYIRQVLFIIFFCCFFTFMIAFRLLTDFVFHGQNFGMALVHMFAFTGTGTFMFLIFGLSPENLRLWKLACGCQPRTEKGAEDSQFLGEEPLVGATQIPDGSVSYVNVGREVGEGGVPRTAVVPETVDNENFHIGTTVITNTTGTPGTAGTSLNFTPETNLHTPIMRELEPREDRHDPRPLRGPGMNREPSRGVGVGRGRRAIQFMLPAPPQLVLNGKGGNGGRVISSRGHEEEPEVEDPEEADYIELER